jgi:hypothetical protein
MRVAEIMNGNNVVTMIKAAVPVAPRVRKRKMPTKMVALNCRRVVENGSGAEPITDNY